MPGIQARAKELRLELINSQRLATHFEEHPGDLALLKHDKTLARAPEAPHLKHLPPYLRAAGMPATTGPGGQAPALHEFRLLYVIEGSNASLLRGAAPALCFWSKRITSALKLARLSAQTGDTARPSVTTGKELALLPVPM